MAEEFQTGICGGIWWNNPSKSVFSGCWSPCSTGILSNDIGSFGWQNLMENNNINNSNMKSNSNSEELDDNNNNNNNNTLSIFQNNIHQKTDSDSGGSGSILIDSTLQMMGFGISSSSSSSSDWNQSILHANGGVARDERNYNSILHDNNSEFSSNNCTAISQGFSNGFNTNSYGYPSSFVQTLFDPRPPQSLMFDEKYDMSSSTQNYLNGTQLSSPTWSKSCAPHLKPSLPKVPQLLQTNDGLNYSNNASFWNASSTPMLSNVRANFVPSLQYVAPIFEEKPNCSNLLNSTTKSNEEVGKKGNSEPPFKRPRIETPSPLPTFKVRKEKLGDRITALQQLVSPFGKTDTASVLHEAIEYIKFLHDQVNALSTPYMKQGAPIQNQQCVDKSTEHERSKAEEDLRSRGLCLVPISSTFPVANETTADFWTPTFGIGAPFR